MHTEVGISGRREWPGVGGVWVHYYQSGGLRAVNGRTWTCFLQNDLLLAPKPRRPHVGENSPRQHTSRLGVLERSHSGIFSSASPTACSLGSAPCLWHHTRSPGGTSGKRGRLSTVSRGSYRANLKAVLAKGKSSVLFPKREFRIELGRWCPA